jgi:F-type H+-transporting ATPase subunit c
MMRRGREIRAHERGIMKVVGAVLGVLVGMLMVASPALAQEAGGGGGVGSGLIALAAGLGLGIAAFGAAMAQGKATAAAMESIGRNPNSADRIFTPLIVGLALMEALALYALVVAFTLAGKIPGVG